MALAPSIDWLVLIVFSFFPQESSEDSKRKINEMTSAIEELRNILKETDDGRTII